MRRRSALNKRTASKAACITCRMRRVKCDETKPNCLRCTRSGRECGYRQLSKDAPAAPPADVFCDDDGDEEQPEAAARRDNFSLEDTVNPSALGASAGSQISEPAQSRAINLPPRGLGYPSSESVNILDQEKVSTVERISPPERAMASGGGGDARILLGFCNEFRKAYWLGGQGASRHLSDLNGKVEELQASLELLERISQDRKLYIKHKLIEHILKDCKTIFEAHPVFFKAPGERSTWEKYTSPAEYAVSAKKELERLCTMLESNYRELNTYLGSLQRSRNKDRSTRPSLRFSGIPKSFLLPKSSPLPKIRSKRSPIRHKATLSAFPQQLVDPEIDLDSSDDSRKKSANESEIKVLDSMISDIGNLQDLKKNLEEKGEEDEGEERLAKVIESGDSAVSFKTSNFLNVAETLLKKTPSPSTLPTDSRTNVDAIPEGQTSHDHLGSSISTDNPPLKGSEMVALRAISSEEPLAKVMEMKKSNKTQQADKETTTLDFKLSSRQAREKINGALGSMQTDFQESHSSPLLPNRRPPSDLVTPKKRDVILKGAGPRRTLEGEPNVDLDQELDFCIDSPVRTPTGKSSSLAEAEGRSSPVPSQLIPLQGGKPLSKHEPTQNLPPPPTEGLGFGKERESVEDIEAHIEQVSVTQRHQSRPVPLEVSVSSKTTIIKPKAGGKTAGVGVPPQLPQVAMSRGTNARGALKDIVSDEDIFYMMLMDTLAEQTEGKRPWLDVWLSRIGNKFQQRRKLGGNIKRLEWTCVSHKLLRFLIPLQNTDTTSQKCGHRSHDDFQELSQGAILELANDMFEAGYITHAQISNQTNSPITSLTARVQNIFIGARRRISGLRTPTLPTFNAKSSSIKSIPLQCLPSPKCRWLHMCLNKPPCATKLEPLHVCKDDGENDFTDATFFLALRQAYFGSKRWKERLLFKLMKIEFVEMGADEWKFELCPENLVDHILPNKLPPTLDEYDFLPPPPVKKCPPIGTSHMMHLFTSCSAQPSDTSLYLRHIPKRKEQALSFRPDLVDAITGSPFRGRVE
ncbi:hypothetical protein F5882DRAFT_440623 [Hyaloscypha sp. PMI_1271]|nr:hypothetical protein F5882DRAFT_440623 [Hyaloscypha sp. PMI_1271]